MAEGNNQSVDPIVNHKLHCEAPKGVNKFVVAGQAMGQDQSGRHQIFQTTIVCQACGFVFVNTIQMTLNGPSAITMPKPETGAKPVS